MKRVQCSLLAILLAGCVHAASPDQGVAFEYLSPSGTEFAAIASGAPGRAFLIYYLQSRGAEEPSLVVDLERTADSPHAIARIYDAPEGHDYVPITRSDSGITVHAATPTIIMRALGGWWQRDGLTNYNLDIDVLAGRYVKWGPTSWMNRVSPGELAVSILVRDVEGDGVPTWDLRRLMRFPQDGYYHVNYAERMCAGPLDTHLGVSTLWPFVSSPQLFDPTGTRIAMGGFELPNGLMRPPLVLDWEAGRIAYFSELVTVRHQSCSYGIYATTPLTIGELNELRFETPFAFYDLREARTGYPDLVIRSVYRPEGVSRTRGRWPQAIQEGTRYSWRVNDRPDWDLHFDYKVELAGSHAYDRATDIAGGLATITAPDYDSFPDWLISRKWPFVTFVDTEGSRYRSSEGIYEWSTRSIDVAYLLGRSDIARDLPEPAGAYADFALFNSIRSGRRGEYRIGDDLQPHLYLSPLTNRLHLLGAHAGVHDLGSTGVLRSANIVPNPFLDSWHLQTSSGWQRLLHLEDYLVFADEAGLILKTVSVPFSTMSLLPPTDSDSWAKFRDSVIDVTNQRRNARNLKHWFDAFGGETVTMPNVVVDDVWHHDGRLRFLVHVGSMPDGQQIADGMPRMEIGAHVLEYDLGQSAWRSWPAVDSQLTGGLLNANAVAYEASAIHLVVGNAGTVDLRAPASVVLDGRVVANWERVLVPAGEKWSETVSWAPPGPGSFDVDIMLGGSTVHLGVVEVRDMRRVGLAGATLLSTPSRWAASIVLLLLGVAGGVGVLIVNTAGRADA